MNLSERQQALCRDHARMLRAAGGIPAHGNQRSQWDAVCRFDHPNPDYRGRDHCHERTPLPHHHRHPLGASVRADDEVFLDVPEVNRQAMKLAESRNLSVSFETARMYTGAAPELSPPRLFDVTTFEPG